VALALVEQIAVDFVGDDREVALEADLRHARELGPREHAPGPDCAGCRQEGAGAGVDGAAERVEVHRVAPVAVAGQGDLVAGELVIAGDRRMGGLDRHLHQEPVARLRERAAGHVEAGDHPRRS